MATVITYRTAADFTMPIGRYRGTTLDNIAKTDRGLGYLAWLRDERAKPTDRRKSANDRELDAMLDAYLDDPTIAKEVAGLASTGFTLIELMIVIAILAILCAIMIPACSHRNSAFINTEHPDEPVRAVVVSREHVASTSGDSWSSSGNYHSYSTTEKWVVVLTTNGHTDSFNVSADDWGRLTPGATCFVRVGWFGLTVVSVGEIAAPKVER